MEASVFAARGLSRCGSQAVGFSPSSCGMWDLSRSGLEPMSPALIGGLFIPEPPGRPLISFLTYHIKRDL